MKTRLGKWLNYLPLRFGLASLLVVLTIGCAALGVFMNRVHRQQRAVAEIQTWEGGAAYYDYYEFVDNPAELSFGSSYTARWDPPAEPTKHWLTQYIGDDFCHNVVGVSVSADRVDEAIPVLKTLPHLERIDVNKYYDEAAMFDHGVLEAGAQQRQRAIEQLQAEFPDCEVGSIFFR